MDVIHTTGRLTLDSDGRVYLRIEADGESDNVRIGRMVGGDFELDRDLRALRPALGDREVECVERAWLDHCADSIDAAKERAEWDAGYLADRGVRSVA